MPDWKDDVHGMYDVYDMYGMHYMYDVMPVIIHRIPVTDVMITGI